MTFVIRTIDILLFVNINVFLNLRLILLDTIVYIAEEIRYKNTMRKNTSPLHNALLFAWLLCAEQFSTIRM